VNRLDAAVNAWVNGIAYTGILTASGSVFISTNIDRKYGIIITIVSGII
jgi:hypothetical protein